MAVTIDDYRCKLIHKIVSASSHEQVTRYVVRAIKSLKEHKVNGHVIARFIEKSIRHLDASCTEEFNAQQLENMKAARLLFCQMSGIHRSN